VTDAERLRACLDRLWPHVDESALALTGGVALSVLHAAPRRLADVDFVAGRMSAVRPSVTRDFLVSHFHASGPAVKKAIVQLVDPHTRLRVDVFPDLQGALARATRHEVAGGARLLVSATDLLAHKLALFSRPVDEKHWRDAVVLARLCGEPAPPAPALAADVYSTDLAYVCARCTASATPEFPIAPKRAIFDVLGYV
jgi:hypothetical protein